MFDNYICDCGCKLFTISENGSFIQCIFCDTIIDLDLVAQEFNRQRELADKENKMIEEKIKE